MIPQYSLDPLRQYHIQVAAGEVGRYVLFPGDPKRCAKIAQYFDDPVLVADNREYITYTGTLDGVRVSVISSGIGGPSASIAIEEIVNCGADTIIRVGTCGGMQEEVMSGDLVIASAAVRMEGALEEAAKNLGKKHHIGVVQCKDAFYGQHNPELLPQKDILLQKWDAYMKMGCLASEMESAALFIVGSYRKIRTGTVLLAMANQTRAAKGLPNPIVHGTDDAIKTAIEAVRILIRQDGEKQK